MALHQHKVNVPPVHNHHPAWSTGLYDCCDDPCNCCFTLCCPCVTFGENAEILDEGNTTCCSAGSTCFLMSLILSVFVSGYTCTYRTRLRAHYSLQGDQCEDFCIHLWCFCCAICQEHRELQARGLDPSKGWDANMRKMQRAPLPPVMRR